MKTKLFFIFVLLISIIGCSTVRINPADMKFNKEVINKKYTKHGKLKYCNGKRV